MAGWQFQKLEKRLTVSPETVHEMRKHINDLAFKNAAMRQSMLLYGDTPSTHYNTDERRTLRLRITETWVQFRTRLADKLWRLSMKVRP